MHTSIHTHMHVKYTYTQHAHIYTYAHKHTYIYTHMQQTDMHTHIHTTRIHTTHTYLCTAIYFKLSPLRFPILSMTLNEQNPEYQACEASFWMVCSGSLRSSSNNTGYCCCRAFQKTRISPCCWRDYTIRTPVIWSGSDLKASCLQPSFHDTGK